MPTVEHALIAAAGFGSRLGLGKPKCLVDIGGKTIIEHQLSLLAEVPDVRVVVGYCEIEVMAVIKSVRQDVIFVRNPAYHHTTTLQSLALAAAELTRNCLILDGDMVLDAASFKRFIESCNGSEMRVGVAPRIASDPVYVKVKRTQSGLQAIGFSRSQRSEYEWANIAYVPPGVLISRPIPVFERLGEYLPLYAHEIDRYEIDTPEDLAAVRATLG